MQHSIAAEVGCLAGADRFGRQALGVVPQDLGGVPMSDHKLVTRSLVQHVALQVVLEVQETSISVHAHACQSLLHH